MIAYGRGGSAQVSSGRAGARVPSASTNAKSFTGMIDTAPLVTWYWISNVTAGTVSPRASSHWSIHSTPTTATIQVPSLSVKRTAVPTGRWNEVAGPPSTMATGELHEV